MIEDQKSIVIGTAGHVDHGKTTFVKALTWIDTDRLKEEKERGMTIEPGFAYLKLPSVKVVSIVDVPGHEKFIRNMFRGISEVDSVLLVGNNQTHRTTSDFYIRRRSWIDGITFIRKF